MTENIQRKSGRGGRREGAGRKPGTANLKTREIANKVAEGLTPLEYLMSIVRNELADQRDRVAAAIAAAPYVHPRLSAIAHTGEGGGPIQVARIELVAMCDG